MIHIVVSLGVAGCPCLHKQNALLYLRYFIPVFTVIVWPISTKPYEVFVLLDRINSVIVPSVDRYDHMEPTSSPLSRTSGWLVLVEHVYTVYNLCGYLVEGVDPPHACLLDF